MLWRTGAGTLFSGLLYLASRPAAWPDAATMKIHAVRALFVAGMAITFFWALARLPMAEAIALAFVALVALANGLLGVVGGWFGYEALSFQMVLGWVFAPVMFLIGIPEWSQAQIAGGLFGTKIVLNEFVAFIELGALDAAALTERSRAIVTFALCGFANFSSIAIQMAVTGGLAPNQRPVIARLGLRALAAGSLANLMSAALAGLFLPY